MAKNNNKIHLHVENLSALGPVFEADSKRVRSALKRRPDLTGAVRVTIGYDGDVLETKLKTADVVFAWDIPRAELQHRAPRLRLFHVHGAGINHVSPLDWLPQGVTLANSRGIHGRRATEYATMALLMLNNRIPEMVSNQRAAHWKQCFNGNIGGKRLLIIGVGHIGGDVARWARAMDMKVWGIRRTARPHRYVDKMYRPGDLRKLLPKVDFVLMSAPHTPKTHKLLGADEISLMKCGAGLVNYSRAGCVDYEALRRRLDRGELSAVLDVFDPEPLPSDSPLWQTRNVIITPHCSSDDSDYYTPRTLDLVFDNISRLIAGKRLRNRVSPEHGY